MCTYYHASTKEYTSGQIVSINDFEGETTYDHECRTDEEKRINDLLDAARPEGLPSRKKCIYLFKKLKNCLSYAKSMHIKHVYEVQCNDQDVYGPFPMVLCNTLSHHLQNEVKKSNNIRILEAHTGLEIS